jgi:hypothetical protein
LPLIDCSVRFGLKQHFSLQMVHLQSAAALGASEQGLRSRLSRVEPVITSQTELRAKLMG